MDTIKIPLYGKDTIKGYALIDEDDLPYVSKFRWYLGKSHQGRQTKQAETFKAWAHDVDEETGKLSRKRVVLMSRLIMRAGSGETVDHINRNSLDNRKINLRICTLKQNNQNSSIRLTNTSGFKGVTPFKNKTMSYWRARAKNKEGKTITTYHKTKIEAAKSYDKMAVKFYGKYACTNKSLNLI